MQKLPIFVESKICTGALINSLTRVLRSVAKEYKVSIEPGYDRPEDIFALLIEALHEKYESKVVVLIDEYDNDISRLRTAINGGDADGMMRILHSIVSAIPYHEIVGQPLEKHLHLCMHVIFMMLGANTRCEVATSGGRTDMVAQTPWRVYVFEFKLDATAGEALRQIDDKGYALQWEARGRKVTKIGVNFSSKLRTIESWETHSEN